MMERACEGLKVKGGGGEGKGREGKERERKKERWGSDELKKKRQKRKITREMFLVTRSIKYECDICPRVVKNTEGYRFSLCFIL